MFSHLEMYWKNQGSTTTIQKKKSISDKAQQFGGNQYVPTT